MNKVHFITAISIVFLSAIMLATPVNALLVKPMRIEQTVKQGKTYEVSIQLRNTGEENPRTRSFEIHLVDLTQNTEGGWEIQALGNGNASASCSPWIEMKETELAIPPMETGSVPIIIKVPYRTRGFYFSALYLLENKTADSNIRLAFIVPLIFDIEGRPVRQKIGQNDLSLDYIISKHDLLPTTLVAMDIANEGRTYSTLNGAIQIMAMVEDRWVPVTKTELRETKIIPGVQLHLASDLERRLPSGKYRLVGQLYVDGRRLRSLDKEIDFEGDPDATRLAVDSALIMEPAELFISSAAGATRTTLVSLKNASENLIKISAYSEIPEQISGLLKGNLKGEDISCADWIHIMPPQFHLRGGGRQNVRVVTTMPDADTLQANYYGNLVLKAQYPDGQSAGTTQTMVCVDNAQIANEPQGLVKKITLSKMEEDTYIVTADCVNYGNIHFVPRCVAQILDSRGFPIKEVSLSGENRMLLPLDDRRYSEKMNLGDLDDGLYTLVVFLYFGNEAPATSEIYLKISNEKDNKNIKIMEFKSKK